MINIQKTKKTKNGFLLDAILIGITLVFVLNSGFNRWQTNRETVAQTKAEINAEADLAVIDINNRLSYLMKTGQDFADAISNGKVSYPEIPNRAKQILEDNYKHDTPSKFYNFSVSFAKGLYDLGKPEQLANWIYISDKKTGQVKLIKRDYDYTIDDHTSSTNWFVKTVTDRKPFWNQPKFGEVSRNFLVSYTIPFYTSAKKEKVAGVVSVGFSTDELKIIMDKQDYRKAGFSMILSDEGQLIYHPNYLAPLAEISKHYEYFQDEFDFINQLKQGHGAKNNNTVNSYELPKSHEKVWVLFKKIQLSNWDYQIIFLESGLNLEKKTLDTKLHLIVAIVAFVISLTFVLFIRHYKNVSSLWYFSCVVGVTFLIATAFLWRDADSGDIELSGDKRKIVSAKDVLAYEKDQEEFLKVMHKDQLFYIPTGMFVKEAEFQGSNNIVVAGYVWQKYQLDGSLPANEIPKDFCNMATDKIPKNKRILLTEAFEDHDKLNLTCDKAIYTNINNRTVTIGWYFNVKLRQPFDYSNFPLDKNLVWIRMHPTSTTDYIVLTPDFSTYPYVYEKSLMGIDVNNFVLPGWKAFSTFYTAQTSNLNSNFGIDNYKGQISQELAFNIGIKRVFLDTIFSTVVPILLIYLILFVILFSALEDLLSVLGISAGLLFSVALWHSGLRTTLASTGITYFETFYFVCYLMISLVCINSVLLASQYELPWLHYKNNLPSKLVFLPFVSALTFVITLVMLF